MKHLLKRQGSMIARGIIDDVDKIHNSDSRYYAIVLYKHELEYLKGLVEEQEHGAMKGGLLVILNEPTDNCWDCVEW
ncbi:MAG: hypothetical protein WA323_22260 [Candidatus Nitrosopolaris sp.]